MRISIEYPERLRSPADAAALYRGLGDERVGVRGFRTPEPHQIAQIVSAIEPGRAATLDFETGHLDRAGWARLEELVAVAPSYLDLHAGGANLRVTQERARVYGKLPSDGIAGVAAAAGAPLRAGVNAVGAGTIAIDPVAGYPLAVAVETADRAFAMHMFRALGDSAVTRGRVSDPGPPARAVLGPFLTGLGAQVHAQLELDVDAALALAIACSGLAHGWRSGHAHVDFPAGRVYTRLPPGPAAESERARWVARIRAAAPIEASSKPQRP